jgi:CDGSH-type Zn-finger protein/truncated hemoglobin YjbI
MVVADTRSGRTEEDASMPDVTPGVVDGWLTGLVREAATLAGSDWDAQIAGRLQDTVVRPLIAAMGPPSGDDEARAVAATSGTPQERLWELTKAVTRLCASPTVPPGVVEAAAGLQDLACRLADAEGPGGAAARVAELAALQPGITPGIRVAPDGPYLLIGVTNLANHLGESLPTRPQMALCRCGASAIKPTCDGACSRTGFTDDKDPNRVPDRRDRYVGQQVTVLDNRGICQHSGYCTDRLPSVFHLGEEPFITPSGGRMDEIIRAVRDCPSGALSYAIDGEEARGQVDYAGKREPAVMVWKDGPYRITGGIPLVDGSGEDEPRNQGASREHYALCRCGHSQNKPFCSGMHWYVGFADPVPDPGRTPTIFEWAGGLPALTRMTRLFYEKYVPNDPLLAPLFANMPADHPQRVAMWLGEVFGGPARYSQEYGGYPRMVAEHRDRGLTEEWRARWVSLLMRSAQEAGLPNDPEFRSAFGSYIEWGSRLAVENSQPGARPPEHLPMPHWDWATAAGPPGSRISALTPPAHDEEEQPVVLPAHDEPVRFETHIKPLFRERDRQSMTFVFDLWSYADVRQHAEAILARLRDGTMPCDGTWPAERIEVFQRWLDAGTPA